mgnify:CR=1 FL=1|jgi:hypothetical protein
MPVDEEGWVRVIDKDLRRVDKVTRTMVEAAGRQRHSMRGSVRLMTGRLSTSEELEERRRQARKPLIG